jgi:hypothetical protein
MIKDGGLKRPRTSTLADELKAFESSRLHLTKFLRSLSTRGSEGFRGTTLSEQLRLL